ANSGTMIVNNDSALVKDGVQSDGTVGGQQPGVDCFPAPKSDDIREINPAIGADVAAAATNGLDQLENILGSVAGDFKTAIESLEKDKNPFAKLPDLSKIIPGAISSGLKDAAFSAVAGKLGGVAGIAAGSLASNAIGGITAAASGYGQTSLQAGLAAGQKATDAVTASLAANEKIASVSGAAKSKASSLLGGT
ncbi:MAG: hypothetical protein ACKVJK_13725, partial [Methylophagaceae bacterium]